MVTSVVFNQSGMTSDNVVLQAKLMYLEIEKKPFSFDHCWGILESSIKWQQLPSTSLRTGTPRTTTDFIHQSTTQVPNSISLADDHDKIEESPGRTLETRDISGTRDSIESPRRKRPFGRKADTTARRKNKVGDPDNVRVVNLMEEFNKSYSEHAKNKTEREERKLKVMEDLKKVEENKERVKEKMEDERIMAVGISNMDQQIQVYYQLRRNEIMNRTMSQSGFFARSQSS